MKASTRTVCFLILRSQLPQVATKTDNDVLWTKPKENTKASSLLTLTELSHSTGRHTLALYFPGLWTCSLQEKRRRLFHSSHDATDSLFRVFPSFSHPLASFLTAVSKTTSPTTIVMLTVFYNLIRNLLSAVN